MKFYVIEETEKSHKQTGFHFSESWTTINESKALAALRLGAKVFCLDMKEVTEMNVEVKTNE